MVEYNLTFSSPNLLRRQNLWWKIILRWLNRSRLSKNRILRLSEPQDRRQESRRFLGQEMAAPEVRDRGILKWFFIRIYDAVGRVQLLQINPKNHYISLQKTLRSMMLPIWPKDQNIRKNQNFLVVPGSHNDQEWAIITQILSEEDQISTFNKFRSKMINLTQK